MPLTKMPAQWRGAPRTLARLIRDTVSPHQRAVRLAMRARPGQMFQPAADTWSDRHPRLFAFIKTQMIGSDRPRLLSFGCSTGEEAFTLATYVPNAAIDAVDVNARNIRIACRAMRRHPSAAIRFRCQDRPSGGAESYDAIFCLSVLRHGTLGRARPDCCSAIIPFSRFDGALASLDVALKPGGLLCLWGANFRFADASIADRYVAIGVPGMPAQSLTLYGPDDRRLRTDEVTEFVFRKLS